MNLFTETNLSPDILKAIGEMGYESPTEIQKQTIPFILSDIRDLIALAQTGTGKTAAFSLPILDMIDDTSRKIQLLVLCPTRELCLQITKDIKNYSKYMKDIKTTAVYGGSSIMDQMRSLKDKPQIIVGTPGRVIDLINRKALDFSAIHWLVLDEADEMLSMGFKDELETILSETPETKQTFLFSATMSKEVERISKNYLTKPHRISVGSINEVKKNIKHEYYVAGYRQKKEALKRLIDSNPNQYSIIFCRTRMETQEVADFLMQNGYAADALHGDLSQAQRDTVMKKFRLKNIDILVATDVAARGLDVNSLTHVIHYSLPDDPEVFVHRSGRTGRAGKDGISISLIKPEESRKLKQIKAVTKIEINEGKIPTGDEIIKAQVAGVFESLFEIHEDFFEFDDSLIPDLSAFTKEELAHKLLQFQLKDLALYYKDRHDLMEQKLSSRDDDRGSRRDRERGRDRDRSERSDRGERRDRGGKPRKPNEDMVRFFFNLGKKDQLKKLDILDIINKATSGKSKKRAEIGDIEILEKFSFFEVEKTFKDNVLSNIPSMKFKGKEMRAEVAN
ncbi:MULTISPECIES: DEAD/DEAH box helicase [Chryseobacterium]|uniref:ATP-dependent RNA helicase DeaD n=1 Tax=Chryseobacterium camelliae TaxID=1265445 RepID=A0ABU0TLQ8_9FLAO|nr:MULTISPECIES: DEAD/DEAH box helicase [Chryseobacterium]MDT3408985.1 ATP-dependent RNA helicase DeaD [Pseudacidovorax intermedius]MDQ1097158.1 ATP-dependent RNA helicase DeaD [Chryseobacterium camelliae]MDQ1101095.1 ATP-dependent RNA helicase DeaD [Chryseobacterium sp. SORGH_AS_1048]MDR6084538.1 ATP-dependent RNA helicase DeaD [Chryseobacterium sp. SORGH_AS_0909]MDR6132807.1 ATP-dependent RNA helicase DeaD [Chryseobacterium sp. SORGH_AS_1175]